jgi:hypothetical protein
MQAFDVSPIAFFIRLRRGKWPRVVGLDYGFVAARLIAVNARPSKRPNGNARTRCLKIEFVFRHGSVRVRRVNGMIARLRRDHRPTKRTTHPLMIRAEHSAPQWSG